MERTSRAIVGILAGVSLLLVGACAPAASPTPTTAPAKPAATSAPVAKPAEASPAPAKPAATASAKPAATASAKPAASADWKAEWDKTVAEAKKEGRVVIAGARGDTFRNAALEFQKAYPEIKVEYTGAQGSTFAPKILAERDGGQYLWDVHIGGSGSLAALREKKILDPLKPVLVLPEVLDDKAWVGGLDGGWLDSDGQYIYAFLGFLYYGAHVNRALVPESELSAIEQLVDPKWKGKIAMYDPRSDGASAVFNSYLIILKGEDFVRKLLSQDLIIQPDARLMLEGLIRQRFPIAMGVTQSDFQEFKQQGVTGDIKPVDPNHVVGTQMSAGSGNVALINRAPDPNAAKVFINWLLSKEGMAAHAKFVNQSTRRIDIPQPTEDAPNPNLDYIWPNHEKYGAQKDRAIEIAKEIVK